MKPVFWIGLMMWAMAAGAVAGKSTPRNLSGFEAWRLANQAVPAAASGRVTSIYSDQTTGGLEAEVWYVEYVDPAAPFKKIEVKIYRGKVISVSHPHRVKDVLRGVRPFERRQLKIDSNRALKNILKAKDLGKLNLQAAQYQLLRTGQGPVWRIEFWTPQLNKPGQLNSIGSASVSTQTGEIFKSDLHY